ncbi:uncharacterized protein LOC111085831 [Limulus polyphemus]|uniref:Uncharacterized protein LOC111085831 n=1 Tax=Limulus polyphemus TaxID=6850 RepID=A0ABM1SE54_LIMPO|nr:uncharacterized protein LOC111085831 [Limulus polyphemus]
MANVKSRKFQVSHDVIGKMRHRQSDARWRAGLANCFSQLRRTVNDDQNVNTERFGKRKASKAEILKASIDHVQFLESTVEFLIKEKAKHDGYNEKTLPHMYTLDYYKEIFCLEEAKENNGVKQEKYLQRTVSYPRKRHVCGEGKANTLSLDKNKIPRTSTKLDSFVTVYPTVEHSYHISSHVTETNKEACESKKNHTSRRSRTSRKENVTPEKMTLSEKKESIFEQQNSLADYDYDFVCNRLWKQEPLPSLVTPVLCAKSQKSAGSCPVGVTTVEATPCSSLSNSRKRGRGGKRNSYIGSRRKTLSSVRRNILDSFVSDDSDEKNYVMASKLGKSSRRKKSLKKSQPHEKGKNQKSEKSIGKSSSKKSIKTNIGSKNEPITPVRGVSFRSPGNGSSVYHYHPITPPRFNQDSSLAKVRYNKFPVRRCLNSSLEDCSSKSQRNIVIAPEKDDKKNVFSSVSVGPMEKQVSKVLSPWLCRKHIEDLSNKEKLRDTTEVTKSVNYNDTLEFEGYQLFYKRVKKHLEFKLLSDNQDDIAVSELISQMWNNLEEDQRATISSIAAAQIQSGNSPDPSVTGRCLKDLPLSLKLDIDENELSSVLIHVSQNNHDKLNQFMEEERDCRNSPIKKTSGDEKDLDISPFCMGLSPCVWDMSWLQTTFSVSSNSSSSDICSSLILMGRNM